MANVVKLKRGSGSDPSASDMVVGEPVIRTDTAELFFKKDDGSVAKVSGGGGGPDFKYLELRNAANNGAASYPGNDFTLVSAGTTNAISPAAANTLLISVSGVIQKPNSGTSTSGITGFIVDGSRLKWATNIPAAPDFVVYQESGGIGEPSDATVTEAKLQVSNSPVNGYFLSAQSGNTGGLTWAAPVATSCTGNSATATALATARAINGVNFDGTAAITVTAAAGTLSGNTLNSSVVTSSLTSLGDLAGLTVDGDMTLTGANYNVLWDKSDNALEFADSAKLILGSSADCQILHDGTDTFIQNKVGDLRIANNVAGDVGGDITIQAMNGEDSIKCIHDGAVELYHNNALKFQTTSTGVTIDGHIRAGDNDHLYLGDGEDISIYHDGTDSYFYTGAGTTFFRNGSNEKFASFISDGAVELYHNNSKKLETVSTGVYVYGDLVAGVGGSGNFSIGDNQKIMAGNGNDLQIFHDGSNSVIDNNTGELKIQSDNFQFLTADGSEKFIDCNGNGNVELYHNNSKKLETLSDGVNITGTLKVNGSAFSSGLATTGGTLTGTLNARAIVPTANNTYDLGSNSARWRDIYTGDLNLSNEGGANDVDGTWGSYTIQEGAEDLFLVNKRSGKKYKFNLTEVS